jgi:spore germination protein GerM
VYRRPSGKKYTQKRREAKIPASLIFWTAFLILIAGLFFINRDRVMESLEKTRILEKLSSSMSAERQIPAEEGSPARPPAEQTPAGRETREAPRRDPPDPGPPPISAAAPGTVQSAPRPIEQRSTAPPVRRSAESTTEHTLYFIRVEDNGAATPSGTTRRIPLSGTPLQDTLEALIAGPDTGEERRGMVSLIPPGTKVLSAVIEGTTARINFSEEFQYNTAGMEGFAAQLTQIIWTATEFPNVQDVQILIEGSRIDLLGEGLPVWGPLNRQSF